MMIGYRIIYMYVLRSIWYTSTYHVDSIIHLDILYYTFSRKALADYTTIIWVRPTEPVFSGADTLSVLVLCIVLCLLFRAEYVNFEKRIKAGRALFEQVVYKSNNNVKVRECALDGAWWKWPRALIFCDDDEPTHWRWRGGKPSEVLL